MRFIKSAGTTVIFKVLAMASGLAVSVIISRTLGPECRGIYGIIMTVLILGSSFGVFGLNTSNTYLIARKKSRCRTIGDQSLLIGLIGIIGGKHLLLLQKAGDIIGIDVVFGTTQLVYVKRLHGIRMISTSGSGLNSKSESGRLSFRKYCSNRTSMRESLSS